MGFFFEKSFILTIAIKFLVFCPKKLSENWNTYKDNYVNNPIASDRLNYDVLCGIDGYKGLLYHGVPVSAILQAYSICQIQPDPGFSDDNNYLKNSFAEAEHVNLFDGLDKQAVIASDGTDLTELVEKTVAWLTEHSF